MRRFDYATLAVFAHRSWQAIAGLVTLVCVAHFLSPVEQGYYYTFASLAALQMVLDMGLSTVLVQVSAHEFGGLAWQRGGGVAGQSTQRFLALINKSFLWYSLAAVVFLLAYPGGLLFLAGKQDGIGNYWHGAWLVLVIATSASLLVLPALSIVEGSGNVTEVYGVRLAQSCLGALAVWITLLSGGGLYAIAMMPAAAFVVAALWVLLFHPALLTQTLQGTRSNFHWNAEVWPMQWRLGVSWICGYLLVQMHTPLLFRTQGPISAGQMGLTLTIVNMISLLSLAWVTSRSPTMAKAASMRDWKCLDQEFWKACRKSILAFIVGASVFLIVRIFLDSTHYGIRFLPIPQTMGLLLAVSCAHMTGLLAIYLRAHKKEPFMWPSVIGAVITAVAVIYSAPRWGAGGIVITLIAVNALFGLPIALWMWRSLRRLWHAPSQVLEAK